MDLKRFWAFNNLKVRSLVVLVIDHLENIRSGWAWKASLIIDKIPCLIYQFINLIIRIHKNQKFELINNQIINVSFHFFIKYFQNQYILWNRCKRSVIKNYLQSSFLSHQICLKSLNQISLIWILEILKICYQETHKSQDWMN